MARHGKVIQFARPDWITEFSEMLPDESVSDEICAGVNCLLEDSEGAKFPIRIMCIAARSNAGFAVHVIAHEWAKRAMLPGRVASSVLMNPPGIDRLEYLGIASARSRFVSLRGVPYEGIVNVVRTRNGNDVVTRCIYPASMREEMFDYAHRQLIASVRLVDA